MLLRFLLVFITIYPFFTQAQSTISELGRLPDAVSETSGLIFYRETLVTHNDSGNTPELFVLDTTSLEVIRSVTITNALNVDWEDMGQDENHIYVADIGNNFGNRRDLLIYKILKSDFDSRESVTAEIIAFNYEDQTIFESSANANDWDAEALFVFEDQLVILTKQWKTNGTKAYAIPKTPGEHVARQVGDFPVNGLVTGATYNSDTSILMLVGYSGLLSPFLLRVNSITKTNIFSGTVERTNLNLGFVQAEAIAFTDNGTYYFSSERFTNNNPPITSPSRLFSFKLPSSPIIETPVEIPPLQELPSLPPPMEEHPIGEHPKIEETLGTNALVVFQSFGSRQLQYQLDTNQQIYGRAIFDSNGRKVLEDANVGKSAIIDVSPLAKSIYYLTFYLQGKIISKPFILN